MELNREDLEKILDRFEDSKLNELELKQGDFCIRLKKDGNVEPVQNKVQAAPIIREEKPEDEKKEESEAVAVKAPLVGTFYAAPDPHSEPYVKEGQVVKKGEIVGLIEAMKMMNEIPAQCDGVISRIAVKNGDFVAYDQELLYIREAANV